MSKTLPLKKNLDVVQDFIAVPIEEQIDGEWKEIDTCEVTIVTRGKNKEERENIINDIKSQVLQTNYTELSSISELNSHLQTQVKGKGKEKSYFQKLKAREQDDDDDEDAVDIDPIEKVEVRSPFIEHYFKTKDDVKMEQ